jgi:hypothetical protein
MYTALELHPHEQDRLKGVLSKHIPEGWTVYVHHMTINMGPAATGPAAHLLGKEASVHLHKIGKDDLVVAVEVVSEVPSINERKHVTLAVNTKAGGKPRMSNAIKEWTLLNNEPLEFKGIVKELQ